MQQKSSAKDYLSIFQDNSRMIVCQPFGIQSKKLEFKDLTYEAVGEWQHVACSYSENVDLLGIYFD